MNKIARVTPICSPLPHSALKLNFLSRYFVRRLPTPSHTFFPLLLFLSLLLSCTSEPTSTTTPRGSEKNRPDARGSLCAPRALSLRVEDFSGFVLRKGSTCRKEIRKLEFEGFGFSFFFFFARYRLRGVGVNEISCVCE